MDARLSALRQYAKSLLEWNHGVSNLISHNDEPRLVERHIAESLVPAKALSELGIKRFVDFGSGAGLPAVPLSLCGIGELWTLVESRRNKTLFLRKLKQDKILNRGEVITGRLEILVEEDATRLQCDGFTSRATAAMGPTLELAGRIVSSGGRAFLWKGSSYEEEMRTTADAWGARWRLESVIPIAQGPNVVAIFIKI